MIYKYLICSAEYGDSINKVRVPKGAKLLSVKQQGYNIFAWYYVDPNEKDEDVYIWYQIGTGHPFKPDSCTFVDTIVNENAGLVWHMFCLKAIEE